MEAIRIVVALLFFFFSRSEAELVCYGELGCFTDAGCHAAGFPPQSPEFINTRFYLFTRRNMLEPQELVRGDVAGLRASNFDANKKTKFSIHGWNSNYRSSSETDRRKAFLETEDVNVIMVDWRRGASGINYPKNHQNTRVAGRDVALMARFINLETGMFYNDVHLVGHSLGAHLAGYAGEYQPGFARITGTDPAGPFFRNDGPECRLDQTDALFVDNIHSDSNDGIGLGMMLPMGHQDFYPNGGQRQPACDPPSDIAGCSHAYSNYYFSESIRSKACRFTAYPCDSEVDYENGLCDSCGDGGCSEMGYHADEYMHLRGTFVLDTNAQSPYCVPGPWP